MSRKLTATEIEQCQALFDTIWKHTYKYGDPNKDEKNACIRLRNTNNKKYKNKIKNKITKEMHPTHLYPYIVGYMLKHEITMDPASRLTLSHICGKPKKSKKQRKNMSSHKCMNGCHIILESQHENNKRKICHGRINKYYNKHYSQSGYIGRLYVKDTIDVNIMSVIEIDGKQVMTNDVNKICKHNPKCFVSWNKI